jgi:hypothetical protein
MLSHVGVRRLQALRASRRSLSDDERALARLFRLAESHVDERRARALVERGWAQPAPEPPSKEAIRLLYRRNPLEHVDRVNFEVTTRCNFACRHCRNEGAAPVTEGDVPSLVEAARLFLSLGIRRFDFIGGEVTRYGDGWLELAEEIARMDREEVWPQPLAITVYTNGWWLGARDFEAAGRSYRDAADYLSSLAAHGVTHVLFSIDGPEPLHDDWRGHPGLFRRVLDGIPRVLAAGLAPRLTVVTRSGESFDYLRPLAQAIYRRGDASLGVLARDPFNHVSQFIDIGRGVQFRRGLFALDEVDPRVVRCKAFFRPDTLRIMANGEVGICPLMLGGEAYGNVHRRPLLEILNRLHEAPLYGLHATGDIARFVDGIDRAAFGDRFDHPCSVRVEANRVALASSATGSFNQVRRGASRSG